MLLTALVLSNRTMSAQQENTEQFFSGTAINGRAWKTFSSGEKAAFVLGIYNGAFLFQIEANILEGTT